MFVYDSRAVSEELIKALKLIAEDFPIVPVEKSGQGTTVRFTLDGDGPGFYFKDGVAMLLGATIPHALRSLAMLRGHMESGQEVEEYREKSYFDMLGLMLDASRNGVPNASTVKLILRKMALMGMNVFMLYTEDTYEVPGHPLIGYLRGRYTHAELRELDDYAFTLGIEMFPCIQTLSHLGQMLHWPAYGDVKDTPDTLLVGDEKTYALLEEMIAAVSAPFRSKRINIGMDEAHSLGLGRYLQLNGIKPRFEIMNQHLNKVMSITRKLGLKPMIWSDMYFRLGSETGDYYDWNARIPTEVAADIPEDVDLVYWDYYHPDKEFYLEWIDRHRAMGKEPVFAGGVWNWHVFWSNINRTIVDNDAAMSACKEKGLREVFTTAWADDGTEVAMLSMLPGLQHFADHGYRAEVSFEDLDKSFKGSCGDSITPWLEACKLDDAGNAGESLEEYYARSGEKLPEELKSRDSRFKWLINNPSKFLMWQDPLLGQYDVQIRGMGLANHYRKLSASLRKIIKQSSFETDHLLFALYVSEVLEDKSEIGLQIMDAYKARDIEKLSEISDRILPRLIRKVKRQHAQHGKLWFYMFKPHGWEVMDGRYGALINRLETTRARLRQFVAGEIDAIQELDDERIQCWPGAPGRLPEIVTGYRGIITTSIIT